MKKLSVSAFALIFVVLLAFGCGSKKDDDKKTNDGEKELGLGMLKVSDEGYITDEEGNAIVLRGVNLGGWLIQETWMGPIASSESASQTLEILKERGFEDGQIKELYNSYVQNFITKADIQNISDLGLNCIRLPFWYRNFMDEELNFYSGDPGEIFGFQVIDRLIEYAKEAGVYIILDMHGCPGGQSTDHSCGVIGQNALYTDEKYLDAMQRLWEAIAERYKDCGTIAAYDIMNEPMNNNSSYENGWAAGSDKAVSYTLSVYDRMIKAIRRQDIRHIIALEGVWSTDVLPDPKDYDWTNIMYELHLYDTSVDMIDYRVAELERVRREYRVAVYVGEFNNGDANQEYAYQKYNESSLSWTMWTYKVTKANLGNWSLYRADLENADIEGDSYDRVLELWGEKLKTENFEKNTAVERLLKKYAKG